MREKEKNEKKIRRIVVKILLGMVVLVFLAAVSFLALQFSEALERTGSRETSATTASITATTKTS